MTAPPPKAPYLSPATWARQLLAQEATGAHAAVSAKTLVTARRIHALSPVVKQDLDALKAPLHVFRWVAWASAKGPRRYYTPERERCDLVLHLRRTFERGTGDGWFLEREHSAAWRVWMVDVAAARERGSASPRADEIAPERYMAAMVASAERPARAPRRAVRELAKKIVEQLDPKRG